MGNSRNQLESNHEYLKIHVVNRVGAKHQPPDPARGS